jgi:methionyl-tRNA formyltransferase
MKKIYKIGFFGDDRWAHKTLNYLLKDKSIIIEFVCGRFLTKDKELKKITRKNNIQFFKKKNVNNINLIKLIKKKEIDLLVSMSFDQIFKKDIINSVNKKIINCHAGKLPFYRGRNILNWALINGEKEFGITTHFINEKIDCGKIIRQKVFKISKDDDYKSLLDKSYNECAKILYKTIKSLQNNDYIVKAQNTISSKSSYFRKRIMGDEVLNLKKKSNEIVNFVKALVEPGPLARINLRNNQIFIKKVSIVKDKTLLDELNNNIIKIKNNKIYLSTIDKKILCIEKWYLKNKQKKNAMMEII